tara:strand:- start:35 stop:232 length:198 start_codon:yes stop_codon:yes gene_type:complete
MLNKQIIIKKFDLESNTLNQRKNKIKAAKNPNELSDASNTKIIKGISKDLLSEFCACRNKPLKNK